jgi:hypothetical protein
MAEALANEGTRVGYNRGTRVAHAGLLPKYNLGYAIRGGGSVSKGGYLVF